MNTANIRKQIEKELSKSNIDLQLKLFSVSDQDYASRKNSLISSMIRTAELENYALQGGAKRRVSQFAAAPGGMGAADLRGLSIFPATILSYVNSIAPIFSVERDLDSIHASLMYFDFYSLMTGEELIPNLGKDKIFGKVKHVSDLTSSVDGTAKEFSVTLGKKLIPGMVKITYKTAKGIETIYDDKRGKLMAAPGLLVAGEVDYTSGTIEWEFSTAPVVLGTKLTAEVAFDVPAESQVDKLAQMTKYFSMSAKPIEIPLYRNIITDAALNKQGVVDVNELYANLIQTQYTKLINEKVADAMLNNHEGDTYDADLSGFDIASGRYDTFIRTFQSLLVDGESKLGAQTYKGAKVTGILGGKSAVNAFQFMNSDEGWIPNLELAYFKDLLGWYRGTPVVRWEGDNISEDDLYLTHKTADGQLAPTFRGTYLTPTDLPEIGNFQNPSQVVNGMFSMEDVEATTSKLVVKLNVKLPESQKLTLK